MKKKKDRNSDAEGFQCIPGGFADLVEWLRSKNPEMAQYLQRKRRFPQIEPQMQQEIIERRFGIGSRAADNFRRRLLGQEKTESLVVPEIPRPQPVDTRSEERRVGKECR